MWHLPKRVRIRGRYFPEHFSPGKEHLQIVKLKTWLHVVFVKPTSEVASSFGADGVGTSSMGLGSGSWICKRS